MNEQNFFKSRNNPKLAPHAMYESAAAINTTYDFIVIGAGSAGCIVASNLATNFPDKTVCLIEAGPQVSPDNQTVWNPENWVLVSQDHNYEWGYTSTPQSGLNNRVIPMGRAKGLGGCSIHNAMVYVRGGKIGFDRWAEEGNIGWDYSSVLPFFEQVENRMKITTIPDLRDPFIGDLIYACNNYGLPFIYDYNAISDKPCVSYMRFAISNNVRETTASVFLSQNLENLTIITQHIVEKIEINPSTKNAESVQLRSLIDGSEIEIFAKQEIILSAGAIGSPQILMLSGLGQEEELSKFKIPVVENIPGVGMNFQDDLYVTTFFKSKQPMPKQPYGLMGAVIFGQSPYSDPKFGTDIECSLAAGTMKGLNLPPDEQQSWLIYPNIQLLASRGTVTLNSNNPMDFPVIDPNYLSASGDLEKCVSAVRMGLEIGQQQGLENWYESTLLPSSTSNLEEYVRQHAGTCYHYAGTCKMGPLTDSYSVVTPDLKVRGINKLRVIDSSIIPTTVSGNTAGATMMIAQKGSSLVSQGI